MLETSVYESPRTNQGPLRRTLAFEENNVWSVRLDGNIYGLYVKLRGVNATIVRYIENFRKASTGTLSELIDVVQDGKGFVGSQTARPRGSVYEG